ncbi:50S ribosomal protein L33 [Alphaproteobacteria bacterium]
MAKKNTVLVRLVSSAGTGYFLVKKKNPKKFTKKLEFRKYDPVVRKHVKFEEKKMSG